MRLGTWFHICMTISYARLLLKRSERDEEPQRMFWDKNKKRFISYHRAFKLLDEYEQRGYGFVPCCENIDDEGRCLGHENRDKDPDPGYGRTPQNEKKAKELGYRL